MVKRPGRAAGPVPPVRRRSARLRSRVHWRARTWDGEGRVSPWSAPSVFELGLTRPADWHASWITGPGWTPQAYGTVDAHPVTVSFPAVAARYVRLEVTRLGGTPEGDSGHYVQLAELEVYSADDPDTNLAEGGDVLPSSTLEGSGWGKAYLTDGVRDTQNGSAHGWTSQRRPSPDCSADPVSVVVDLGAVRTVDRVVLHPRTDVLTPSGATASFPVDYAVRTSATSPGSGFTTARAVTDQPVPEPPVIATPAALPVLAREFTVREEVRSARLYVAGAGVFVASVNGERAGDAVLEPANTDLRRRATYSTYDVTRLLRRGANAVGIRLGSGITDVEAVPGRYTKFTGTQSLPRVLAQLELTLADGTRRTLGTDATWRAAEGATLLAHWYGGEDHDARRALPGWDEPGTDRRAWDRAAVVDPPSSGILLSGRQAPPLRIVDTRTAAPVGTPAQGVRLYDVGVNVAGWPCLTIDAPAGTEITVWPAEKLASGRVDQSATGSPTYNTFVSDGQRRTWHPEFVYQGFQYFEVRGVTDEVEISGASALVVRADNDHVGTFDSSDAVVNGVHELVDRAIQSNMFSVLTDCPTREKLGWMEQNQLVFGSIMRNYDVAAYSRAIVRTIADAQLAGGLVPDIAPEYTVFDGGFRDDPNWGSAIILMPWQMYRNYGDEQTLATYYPHMRAYLAYLDSRASGDLVRYDSGLGDWGELLDGDERTDRDLVANFAYYRAADAMAGIATALGRAADAASYRARADAVRSAFRARWYDADAHSFATGTQASLALALDIGAAPPGDERAVFDRFVSAVTGNGTHLNVGEIALPSAFRVLSAHGRDDLVHALVTQDTAPGYGYFVAQGATSLPEFWDMSGSRNHFMLGAIDEWFSAHLAGIRQADDSVGYRELLFQPSVVGGVTRARAGYRTPYGDVSCSWRLAEDGTVAMDVAVPVGCTATVLLPLPAAPGRGERPRVPGGARYRGVVTPADGRPYAEFTVPSGSWRFDGHLRRHRSASSAG